jgi:hypothetical protein
VGLNSCLVPRELVTPTLEIHTSAGAQRPARSPKEVA